MTVMNATVLDTVLEDIQANTSIHIVYFGFDFCHKAERDLYKEDPPDAISSGVVLVVLVLDDCVTCYRDSTGGAVMVTISVVTVGSR